jgi:hypothetical protein
MKTQVRGNRELFRRADLHVAGYAASMRDGCVLTPKYFK